MQSSSEIATTDKPTPVRVMAKVRWSHHNTPHGMICVTWHLFLYVLMVIFPDEPGLAGIIEASDDGSVDDNWRYKTCKAPVKSSPPTNQHPMFYGPDALPVTQPTASKH